MERANAQAKRQTARPERERSADDETAKGLEPERQVLRNQEHTPEHDNKRPGRLDGGLGHTLLEGHRRRRRSHQGTGRLKRAQILRRTVDHAQAKQQRHNGTITALLTMKEPLLMSKAGALNFYGVEKIIDAKKNL